jgi:N-methylhydantoinase A/oxoprolinase/acetone carboxylase beta subunit
MEPDMPSENQFPDFRSDDKEDMVEEILDDVVNMVTGSKKDVDQYISTIRRKVTALVDALPSQFE